MRKYLIVLGCLALIVAGGGFFLTTWEIPAPKRMVEKVISHDRFK
tara:strand:+ start:577 stop:711 length:135 start_codon:yes stop_codon:yes gene_type:complete